MGKHACQARNEVARLYRKLPKNPVRVPVTDEVQPIQREQRVDQQLGNAGHTPQRIVNIGRIFEVVVVMSPFSLSPSLDNLLNLVQVPGEKVHLATGVWSHAPPFTHGPQAYTSVTIGTDPALEIAWATDRTWSTGSGEAAR